MGTISGLCGHTKKLSENCIYALAATRKRQAALERLLQTCSSFSKSVIVSMSVSKLGPMDLMFIDARVKINACILPWGASDSKANAYHAWDLWRVLYLPARQCCMFLLTKPARQSTSWNETPAFISPDLFPVPPSSTDLNPVHYKNMGINTTVGIASSWFRWTEAALNRCLIEQSVIDDTVDQWCKCLCAWICVKWRPF